MTNKQRRRQLNYDVSEAAKRALQTDDRQYGSYCGPEVGFGDMYRKHVKRKRKPLERSPLAF